MLFQGYTQSLIMISDRPVRHVRAKSWSWRAKPIICHCSSAIHLPPVPRKIRRREMCPKCQGFSSKPWWSCKIQRKRYIVCPWRVPKDGMFYLLSTLSQFLFVNTNTLRQALQSSRWLVIQTKLLGYSPSEDIISQCGKQIFNFINEGGELVSFGELWSVKHNWQGLIYIQVDILVYNAFQEDHLEKMIDHSKKLSKVKPIKWGKQFHHFSECHMRGIGSHLLKLSDYTLDIAQIIHI